MKKLLLFILVLSFVMAGFAQADSRLTLGTVDTMQSTILNEKRKLLIYLPNRGQNGLMTQQRYPVLYLLDGDAFFNAVVSTVQFLSQVNGNTACPEMIVVGISNTNRNRDLTPTKPGDDPMLKNIPQSAVASNMGGGEAFLSFIEKELIPFIDTKYPTQPYKLLMGHSYGGLTVMNALVNHTKLFNSYIAVDPSLWWDDLRFLKEIKSKLAGKNLTGTILYFSIAHTFNEEMSIKKAEKDTSIDTRGVRAELDMDRFLKDGNAKGLRYASKYYDNDTHGTVTLGTANDALHYIFADYQYKPHNSDMLDSTVDFAAKFRVRYQKISKLFGYEVKPSEMEVNRMAYLFLRMKQFKKAESFFKMNAENYPESFNVHDSYGDFFVALGDKSKAKEQFTKALSIKENADTRNKLNKLGE